MTPSKQVAPSSPVIFDYERQNSPSHVAKCAAKEEHRLIAAAKLGHTLCEAEERKREESCSIDLGGVVHNAAAIHPTTPQEAKCVRAKKFHQKIQNRRKANQAMSP